MVCGHICGDQIDTGRGMQDRVKMVDGRSWQTRKNCITVVQPSADEALISVLVASFLSDRQMHRIWHRMKTRSHLFFDVCRHREVTIHHDAQVADTG